MKFEKINCPFESSHSRIYFCNFCGHISKETIKDKDKKKYRKKKWTRNMHAIDVTFEGRKYK